jgi:hypothetical protein
MGGSRRRSAWTRPPGEINALRPGHTPATGQKLGKDASALKVLREAVRRTDSRTPAGVEGPAADSARALLSRLRLHRRGEVKLASKAALG